MTEMYDMVMMVGNLVLVLVIFWFLINAASLFLDEFSNSSVRLLQEFVSGYISMSNFAPMNFSVEEKFPAVSHMMKVYKSPQLISVKVGSRGTASINPMTGEKKTNVMVSFAKKSPLAYFLSDGIVLNGNCIDNYCAFSGENPNKIKINKRASSVSFMLNRETLITGTWYKLGDKIFSGECNSKIYSIYYLFGGTDSIRVQVEEDGQIIYDGIDETHEILIGETKTINDIKITLYELNTVTNMASIFAECN